MIEAPWKDQPPCTVCGLQHAGYENAHDPQENPSRPCPDCSGSGEVGPYLWNGDSLYRDWCPRCDGSGRIGVLTPKEVT